MVDSDIKIYNGTTIHSVSEYKERITHLKNLTIGKQPLFTELKPSTLTAQGTMIPIEFDEKNIIDTLSKPTGHILMIGCNYGEKYNESYKPVIIVKTSGRGRKPKQKQKSRRKIQGNGRYFSSQITFLIEHPDIKDHNGKLAHYKIKLFRNGVFQVPGVRNPDMSDLVKPIRILKDYLTYNFGEEIQVGNFMAVMRNYKSSLLNKFYHVNLEKLEEIILREKFDPNYEIFLNYMLQKYNPVQREKIKELMGNFNPLNIAEMTYNTDRCFCLIIKFYRPSLAVSNKKTTVKLLKKGKINFDGGNSQQEIEELYAWLEYIYNKYKKEILFDIRDIENDESDSSDCAELSIYDEDEDECECECECECDSDNEMSDKNENKDIKDSKNEKVSKDTIDTTDTTDTTGNTDTTKNKNKVSRDPSDIIMKALRRPIKREEIH